MKRLLLWLLAMAAALPAFGHEMTMAEMQLRETQRGEFLWQWGAGEKRPVAQDLTPVWPQACQAEVTRAAESSSRATARAPTPSTAGPPR